MSGMFGRVLHWFANEFIVNTLANSRSFQRLALRIDSFLSKQQTTIKAVGEDAKKVSEVKAEEINKKAKETIGFDVKAFLNTIKEEIQKDIKDASVGGSTKAPPKK